MQRKRIKEKWQSRSGNSMLLALIFLMFCLFVGSSVLAAATANAGRVAGMQSDAQHSLSQRAAMLLMADQLQPAPEAQLQLTIQDVTVTAADGVPSRIITYRIHGDTLCEKSAFQKLLYTFAVHQYEADRGVPNHRIFKNFDFVDVVNDAYQLAPWSQMQYDFPIEGILQTDGGEPWESWQATCCFSENCDLRITFPENAGKGQICLTMDAYSDTGKPIITFVDGVKTETTTTVIRWENPVIGKGGTQDA